MDIFLFIDALGWDVVEPTAFLEDVLPYRRPVTMQFGYSSSAIPTILSGTRPAEHGHLGLFRYAPEASPFRGVARVLRLLRPKAFWNRGRVRGWLSKAVAKALGFTGYFQLYQMPVEKLPFIDYCEKENLFVRGGMGSVRNLADVLAASGRSHHISDWHLPDAENLAIGAREIAKGTSFVFLYTASLDALRHDHPRGVADEAVRAKLAWYRAWVERLVAAAKARGEPWSLTVFSDHGMTPCTGTVDLKAAVEATGFRFGEDYGACYDSTLLRVTFLKPGVRARIEAALAPFAAQGHWLTADEEARYGLARADRRFGEAIFLVNPGLQIVPSDMGLKALGGMHGYEPDEAHSKAAILSTEPIPGYVAGVWDYFRYMKEKIDGIHG